MPRTTYVRHRNRKPYGSALVPEFKFICRECRSRVVTSKIQLVTDEVCQRCKVNEQLDARALRESPL